ncbi:T9SS C-terminal target domain-containing protein [Sphingobacteriales bacterium UPWRP_1]|nr:hypothetical protein B6N25_07010 [Sphingobacteriales bacterium TSM_CSS]PSJ77290.1 T9SS C-terminal target domain-containing protein [Sphingobacteriales bacterium UPWRP_1]
MKLKIITLCLGIVFALGSAFAQTATYSVSTPVIDCSGGTPTTVCFDVSVSTTAAANNAFAISVGLNYNSTTLTNPTITWNPLLDDGTVYDGSVSSTLPVFNFSTALIGTAGATTPQISSTPLLVGTVCFTVAVSGGATGLSFNNDATLTAVVDGGFNQFDATSGNLTIPASSAFPTNAACAAVCSISNLQAGNQTGCVPASNTYTQAVAVTYSNPPAGGQLNVNGQLFNITTSPQTVILTGLTANGNPVNVTAFFTASPACTFTANSLFTAPANCTPSCSISGITAGTQTACVPASNTYTQQVTVTYSNAPATGQLSVNGQNFAITGSPQTVTLTNLPSDGNAVSVTASFTANASCTFTANNLFTAPASCAVVCSISSITAAAPSACNPATNTYSVAVTVTFSNPPVVGNLVVNAGSGNQTFTGIGTSPRTVTLTNLPANGNPVNVTASFSTNPGCALTVNSLFTAPVSCACNLSIANVGPVVCAGDGTNNYTYNVTLNYSNPPATGNLVVNGSNFAITGSPQTVTLSGIANGEQNIDVSASFSANLSCNALILDIVDEPASCITDPCAGVTVNTSASYTCTGGIQLSGSGGTGPYTFTANGTSISNGAILNNGTYSIVATDANGCSDATPFSLVVNGITNVTATYSCSTGLSFTTTGGVGPFTFTANGSPVSNGSTLADGVYAILATDANSCTASGGNITVSCAGPCTGVTISVSATYDCETGLAFTVTGGTGPYTIVADGTTTVTNGSFLTNGNHTFVATDANGCTGASATSLNVNCGGTGCAGVNINVTASYSCATGLSVSATGGQGPYTFSQGNGAVLADGSYTIVATDDNGCTGSANLTVNCSICNGVTIVASASYDCNAGLVVSASGGTGPYSFTANGSSVNNGAFLPDGTYTIVAFDANGCAGNTSVTVSSISVSVSYDCNGGGLSISASGGVAPYSFSTTQGTVTNGQQLANGTYQFIATDANGCISGFTNFTVNCNVVDPCAGVSIAVSASYSCTTGLSVSASGGSGSYTFSTSNGATLANGTYTITATDSNGCTGTASVTVNCGGGDPCAGVTINVTANYSCATGVSANASGGTGPYSFGPLNGTFLPEGVYLITATDANGCAGNTTLTVGNCNQPPVAVPDAVVAAIGSGSVNFSVLGNDSDPDGDNIVLVSIGNVSPSSAGSVTNFTSGGNVTFTFNPAFSGTTVTLTYTIQDSNGAQAAGTITITLVSCAANAGTLSSSFNLACSNINDEGNLEASPFDVHATGFNNGAGYSQTYLLVSGSGTIVAVSATGDLTADAPGNYSIYALNYAIADAPTFGEGTTLAALNAQAASACFDLSAAAQGVVLSPVTLEVETFCDPTVDGGFFVRLTANGGFPEFSNVGGYGTNLPPYFIPWVPALGAGELISGPYPNGIPCFLVDIVSDGYLCTVGDIPVCAPPPCIIECTPVAGSMSDALQAVCDGGSAAVISSGIEVDPNDDEVGVYVVHSSPDLADGGVLGIFPVPFDVTEAVNISLSDLPGATTNTVYYVSAVVGSADDDGNGIPDLGDQCTASAGSTPIVFLDPLLVDIEPICNDDTQEYALVIAVAGGYPAFDPASSYNVFGDYTGEITNSVIVPGFASGAEYFIGISDAAGCSYTENNIVTCKPTPITLLRFDGKVQTEGNLLNWTTATETDNDFFTLMRSADGVNFVAVGTVDGAGNSIVARNYEFLDKTAPNGLSYYRLNQTDFDGTTTIASEVITLRREATPFGFVEVSPIPTSHLLNVGFNSNISGEVEFTVYDMAGRLTATQKAMAQNGLNNVTIDVSNYPAGVYFIALNNGQSIETTRFVKE